MPLNHQIPNTKYQIPNTKYQIHSSLTGFTLIELLVVITIVALIAIVAYALFSNAQKQAKDGKRKAEVAAIAQVFENNFQFNGGYVDVTANDFGAKAIPADPNPQKGNYFRVVANDKSGYKVCASLDDNPNPQCNSTSQNCFCKVSVQSNITNTSPSSLTGDPTSVSLGFGYTSGSAPSCDPNGTLMNGLVGYWKFDEGTGTTAADSSGNGNSGTVNGNPQWWSIGPGARFSNNLNFDGAGDNVTTIQNANLVPANITVSAWFKVNTFTTDTAGIVSAYWWDNWGTIRVLNNGRVDWNFYDTSTINHDIASSVGSITSGTWYHFAATFDKATTTAKLYLNGNTVGNVSSPSIERSAGGINRVYIGTHFRDSANFDFNGQIDDVRVYNRALSASEVSSLYNSGNGCF